MTFSWHQLGFRFEKLKPSNGFSRLFSKNGAVELLEKPADGARDYIYQLPGDHAAYRPLYPRLILMDAQATALLDRVTICYQVSLRVCIFLLILAAADYAFQKYRFREQLKMTKQEVKDEFKETEGDPTYAGPHTTHSAGNGDASA